MNNSPVTKQLSDDPDQPATNAEITRRLIRLVVGIALVGQDALRKQLPAWEAQAARYLEALGSNQPEQAESGAEGIASAPPATPWYPKEVELRLIGLAFESPHYLRAGIKKLLAAPQAAWRVAAPLRLPLDLLGVTDFTRDWVEGFGERLQSDMQRLEEIGREEAEASRALGRIAIQETVDLFIERLAQNPELQNLVTYQTSSLTSEVVGEVRERTVSADLLVDRIIRHLFKREFPPIDQLKMPDELEAKEARKPEW